MHSKACVVPHGIHLVPVSVRDLSNPDRDGKANDACCKPDCKQLTWSPSLPADEQQQAMTGKSIFLVHVIFCCCSSVLLLKTCLPMSHSHCKVKGPAGLSYQAWTADIRIQRKILSSSSYSYQFGLGCDRYVPTATRCSPKSVQPGRRT